MAVEATSQGLSSLAHGVLGQKRNTNIQSDALGAFRLRGRNLPHRPQAPTSKSSSAQLMPAAPIPTKLYMACERPLTVVCFSLGFRTIETTMTSGCPAWCSQLLTQTSSAPGRARKLPSIKAKSQDSSYGPKGKGTTEINWQKKNRIR